MSNKIYFIVLTSLILLSMSSPALSQSPYEQWSNGPSTDENYFPIGVWLQNPRNANKYQAVGINFYVGLWRGPTEEQLAELKHAGMPVICHQNKVGLKHKDDPIIIGWMQDDEPDNAQPVTDPDTGKRTYDPPVPPQEIVEKYHRLKKNDPTRPIFLNLGQGVANDEWVGRGSEAHPDDYLTYVKGCDILSFDVYPVVGMRKPDGENYLWYVAKGVNRLIKWSEGKKIVWNIIECTHISNEKKKATPHQVKAEVWMSIIHGSKGIVYFVHEFQPRFNEDALLDDPQMLKAVTALNRQIHSLATILNQPTISNAVSVQTGEGDSPVAVMAKKHDKYLYLFTVGMRNKSANATFELKAMDKSKPVKVVGENRTLQMNNGTFKDSYNPYDVHIYQIDL